MITLTALSMSHIVMTAVPPAPSRQDRALSMLAAVALHGLLLFGGGALFVQPAEYGVEAGENGIEVDLVAAPVASAPVAVEAPLVPLSPVIDEAVAVTESEAPTPAEKPAESPLLAAAPVFSPSSVTGDGSSPVPGLDATTFSSRAGAATGKPSYLKNPAPRYPEAARLAGQEGVVLLRVEIVSSGKAGEVHVRQGSGFLLLDDAAVRAVSKWRFRPAKAGGVSVASSADIPVRFRLDQDR